MTRQATVANIPLTILWRFFRLGGVLVDGAQLSRFPHLSWLFFGLTVPSHGKSLSLPVRGVAFGVSVALGGSRTVRQLTNGHEVKWHESVGTVSLVPPDDEQHVYAMTSDHGCQLFAALIPRGHVQDIACSEGIRTRREGKVMLGAEDAVIRDCMTKLAVAVPAGAHRSDEIARRLILRISLLNGASPPDWHDDCSLFDRHTLLNLTDYVDEHLRIAPSLSDMSLLVGMSPSHFARKFRNTTGLSLHRYINRQRILRALVSLKDDSQSLAGIGIDLGFSSQSHFTRLFSDLTGMTPAKYAKQFRRVVG